MWMGREAGAASQEMNGCQTQITWYDIYDSEQGSCSLLKVTDGVLLQVWSVSLPAESATFDRILCVSYGRKLGRIERRRHVPEETCILGRLHVLPSVLLHNSGDAERKQRGGRTWGVNLSWRWDAERCKSREALFQQAPSWWGLYIHLPQASHSPLESDMNKVGKSLGR